MSRNFPFNATAVLKALTIVTSLSFLMVLIFCGHTASYLILYRYCMWKDLSHPIPQNSNSPGPVEFCGVWASVSWHCNRKMLKPHPWKAHLPGSWPKAQWINRRTPFDLMILFPAAHGRMNDEGVNPLAHASETRFFSTIAVLSIEHHVTELFWVCWTSWLESKLFLTHILFHSISDSSFVQSEYGPQTISTEELDISDSGNGDNKWRNLT